MAVVLQIIEYSKLAHQPEGQRSGQVGMAIGNDWPIVTELSVTTVVTHQLNAATRFVRINAESGNGHIRTATTAELADNVPANGSGGDILLSGQATALGIKDFSFGVEPQVTTGASGVETPSGLFIGIIEAS